MTPIKHHLCNTILRRPEGMTEEECGDLHIFRTPLDVTSFWHPDSSELKSLNEGHPLYICFVGHTHPPLSVGILISSENADQSLTIATPDSEIVAFQKYVLDWSRKTFGHSLALPKVHHLRKEVEELLANPTDAGELADCFILLAGIAQIAGVDLIKAGLDKMKINEARTWGTPDENGVCQHIAEGKEVA